MSVTVHLGLMAAAAILIFVALEVGRLWILLPTAMICAALSAYSLLQGAWPVALIEAIWVVVVLRKGPSRGRGTRTP
jgi:hypothetical protein